MNVYTQIFWMAVCGLVVITAIHTAPRAVFAGLFWLLVSAALLFVCLHFGAPGHLIP